MTGKRDFEGKTVLITGGGRGIGKAVTLEFASRGADVVIGFFRNRDAAEMTCAEASDSHRVRAISVRGHLGSIDRIDELFTTIEREFGRLDVFVANAGSGVNKPLADVDERAWSWTFDVNARSLFLGAARARKLMKPGASIIALSSGGSNVVLPGYGLVGASKAAIETLIRYMAVEFGPDGIRANVVSPGLVKTDALKSFANHELMLKKTVRNTPLGRLVAPSDVAHLIGFLASDDAQMITGQVFTVDGGCSLVG